MPPQVFVTKAIMCDDCIPFCWSNLNHSKFLLYTHQTIIFYQQKIGTQQFNWLVAFYFFWDQPLFLVVKGRRFAACNWNGARRHRRHGPAGCSGHVSDLANINVAGKFGWNGALNGKLIYVLIYEWGITRCHVWLLQCKFKYIYIIIYS